MPGYVTLMCGVLGLGGLQLLFLGVIGEYLGRIYDESKRGRTSWSRSRATTLPEPPAGAVA